MTTDPPNSFLMLSEESAQSLLNSQEQRYQHIQNIAQGLLVGGITILAIIATIFAATYRELPKVEISESVVSNTSASISIVSVSELTVVVTIGLGFLLGICYILLGGYSFFKGLWGLFDVTTYRSLGIGSRQDHFYVPKVVFDELNLEKDTNTYRSEIFRQIRQNRRLIDRQHTRFINGSLRLPTGLLIAIFGGYIFLQSASANVAVVVLASASPFVTVLFDKLIDNDDDNAGREDGSHYLSLNQELFRSEPKNRWDKTRFEGSERFLSGISTILSTLILVWWMFAIPL